MKKGFIQGLNSSSQKSCKVILPNGAKSQSHYLNNNMGATILYQEPSFFDVVDRNDIYYLERSFEKPSEEKGKKELDCLQRWLQCTRQKHRIGLSWILFPPYDNSGSIGIYF